jgi:hypothetical protein
MEHALFVEAMELYPIIHGLHKQELTKQWKKIADIVKTRTLVQIRTHAQKCWTGNGDASAAAGEGGASLPPKKRKQVAEKADPTGKAGETTAKKAKRRVEKKIPAGTFKLDTSAGMQFQGGAGLPGVDSPMSAGSPYAGDSESPGGGGRWTKEEDAMLRAGVTAIGAKNWRLISQEYLSDSRSDVQCLHRWQKVTFSRDPTNHIA